MDDLIKKQEGKLFSDQDIMKLCNRKVKVIVYQDLALVDNIDELFDPYGVFVVLYQPNGKIGHWVTVNRPHHDQDIIEQFDSYGTRPDDQLLKSKRELYPLLTDLVLKSGYKRVIYNSTALQVHSKSVNTCGRWAGLRALMHQMPLKKFVNLFVDQQNSPDFYVTALTMFV